MKELVHTINNPNGIHLRPAGLLVEMAQKFESMVTVKRDEESVDGKKLFALMKLRIKYGQTILITTEGDDEEDAIRAIKELLTSNV
jgi:phosphotransferase system HPr (HPr) family protein